MQQRRPLPIVSLSLSKDTRRRNKHRPHKHDRHNCKRERPLQCYSLCKELPDAQSGCQKARRETNVPVFKHGQEESSVHDDAPDGDIGKDAACEAVAVDHDGAVPEDEEEGEGQGHGNDGGVDPAGERRVAEVESSELEELNHLDDFGDDEVGAGPEHDPDKLEDIEAREVSNRIWCRKD